MGTGRNWSEYEKKNSQTGEGTGSVKMAPQVAWQQGCDLGCKGDVREQLVRTWTKHEQASKGSSPAGEGRCLLAMGQHWVGGVAPL